MLRNLPANAGDIRDLGSIPRLGRSPGQGHGNPLQHSCLENPMDRGAWWTMVHGVTKHQTQLKRLSMHTCTSETNTISQINCTSIKKKKKQQSVLGCRASSQSGGEECSLGVPVISPALSFSFSPTPLPSPLPTSPSTSSLCLSLSLSCLFLEGVATLEASRTHFWQHPA